MHHNTKWTLVNEHMHAVPKGVQLLLLITEGCKAEATWAAYRPQLDCASSATTAQCCLATAMTCTFTTQNLIRGKTWNTRYTGG